MKVVVLGLCLLILPFVAFAEGGCPPGQYPIGGQGVVGCAPIPGAKPSGNAAPSGRWETRWGAIAEDRSPSPGQSLATGLAKSMPSKRAATNAALDRCRAKGGNKCEIRISYYNQCVALADPVSASGDMVGGVSTASRALGLEKVRAQALAECSSQNSGARCALAYSACSMSEWVPSN